MSIHQPRTGELTREAALREAKQVEDAMQAAGFIEIRTQVLELKPAPAVAVIGRRPA